MPAKNIWLYRSLCGFYKEEINISPQDGLDSSLGILVCAFLCLIASCWQAHPNFALGIIDATATRQ